MISLRHGRPGKRPGGTVRCLVVVFTLLLLGSVASAETSPGWGRWWLPPVRSEHGPAIDSLFRWIFWITMVTFVGVELLLAVFLIKYRGRKDRKKAHFTHGNQRLEMVWTIIPAIILASLALGSKSVWDRYRYAPEDPNRAKLLVIGEQFKWNIIYPGPDGKFGRYLIYPKPTDAKWPVDAEGKDHVFQGVPGPASLPYDQAVAAINAYIGAENPLGKDFSDPNGKDDNIGEAGRKLILPAHRQIEVQLSSKDVIHDFYLPNHRVKLDAVPGMRGVLYFTATMTSAEKRKASVKNVPLDELASLLATPAGNNTTIVIDESAPGSDQNRDKFRGAWRYFGGTPKATIIRNGASFGDSDTQKKILDSLKAAGLTEVKVNVVEDTGEWELVCEELCGQGHQTMHSPVEVLSNEEYDKLKLDTPSTGAALASNAG